MGIKYHPVDSRKIRALVADADKKSCQIKHLELDITQFCVIIVIC